MGYALLCTAAAGSFQTVMRKDNRTAFGLWGFLITLPTHKILPVSQQLWRGRVKGREWRNKKNPVCPLFLLSLYTLPDQGYHKHYTKSSSDCTKNKAIMINRNKKQKHAIKPLETLHCFCRWPYRSK